jgi:hypothetical protein
MISSSDIAAAARAVVAIFEWEGWLTYIALSSVSAKAAKITGFHIFDISVSIVAGRWNSQKVDADNFQEIRINSMQFECQSALMTRTRHRARKFRHRFA